eukprot:GAFH01001306.1.p2 GENE.GAFH01001306.1~~GAFH01001306.1.p2  ORF type:complete len:444 (-),score=96.94 GAFH01001306.1:396-1649(-)
MRNVGPEISQNDLLQTCQPFGMVSQLILLRSKNQALLQFQELTSAIQMMQYHQNQQVNIRGRNIYMQFSSHQELTTTQQPSDGQTPTSRILLVTIQNPLYPITVDVLSQVFSPFETDPRGTVEKIVIFTKQAGLQALVQYSNPMAAAHAKGALDGKNIYANCCTLQIQFSNLTELTVRENSEKSRDFTNPTLPVSRAPPPMYGQLAPTQQMMGQPGQFPYGADKSCLIVSGLAERMDCDRLFNLFSNYGNITRIKLLHNKSGVSLVQMGDNMQANMAMSYLKSLRLFDSPIDINYSRYSTISPPGVNSDGRTKDYTNSPLNRFTRQDSKNFRHISPPTAVLHVSNLAPTTAIEAVNAHLGQHAPVVASRMFTETQGQRKQALVQFATVEQAAEVICLLHNSPLEGQNIRLAFSKNSI